MLDKLYRSTEDLYHRFDAEPEDINIAGLIWEEVHELLRAGTPEEAAEETVDVIVTVMAVSWVLGFSWLWELYQLWPRAERLAAHARSVGLEQAYLKGQMYLDLQRLIETLITNDPVKGADATASTVIAALALAQTQDVTMEMVQQSVQGVILKNDAKTRETHELRDGKIRRLSQR